MGALGGLVGWLTREGACLFYVAVTLGGRRLFEMETPASGK